MHAMSAALVVTVPSLALAADPPVPAGRDPGGFPVAVISAGLDYTQRNIAQMLARDGEGEIIGYDFVDDDNRPYGTGPDADAVAILIGEGQAATVVAIRAEISQSQSLARAIGYAAKSPAPIIAVFAAASMREVETVISAAARRFPRHLFILGAGDDGIDLDRLAANETSSAAVAIADNVLIVTSANANGTPTPAANSGAATVDLAITTSGLRIGSADVPATTESPSNIAVARTAALAARLRAVDPHAKAAELKGRIMGLATSPPPGTTLTARGGWIPEPRRHFWLE